MSYKSTLQEHNTQLQSGNTLLLQAINKANALPNTDASVEDLSAEIESQAQLIALQTSKINELITELNEKAAVGGSAVLETCTLTVDLTEVVLSDGLNASEPAFEHQIGYMKVVDGVPVYSYEVLEGHKTYEITNCLKNSIVVFNIEELGLLFESTEEEETTAEGDAEFLAADPGYFITLWAITGNATIRTIITYNS